MAHGLVTMLISRSVNKGAVVTPGVLGMKVSWLQKSMPADKSALKPVDRGLVKQQRTSKMQ